MIVSVVIRTLNEALYLGELLQSIQEQEKRDFEIEVVLIDSGSTDGTLKIAQNNGSKITYINKEDFSFGRSLNMGSEFSSGDILVYVSGHCVPTSKSWIANLIEPIRNEIAGYSYGGQEGRDTTKFSERRIFEKYFPKEEKVPQDNFFCNNANSAISRKVWEQYRFDEKITGLEDMDLAKRYFEDGGRIAYIPHASVFHIHDETWTQTRRRYEREAIALQKIMPEVQVGLLDLIRYVSISIISDSKHAFLEGSFFKEILGIITFRLAQYLGTFRGNHQHRQISKRRKENYFYPIKKLED